jgi:prophage regulatory protein
MKSELNCSHKNTTQTYLQSEATSGSVVTSSKSPSNLGNILRLVAALSKTGMKRTAFLNLQDPNSPYFDSTFPKRIRLGARSVGWFENELEAWLLSRKANRNGGVL